MILIFFLLYYVIVVLEKKYCKVLYISYKIYWDNMYGICGNMMYSRGICFVDMLIVFLRCIFYFVYMFLKICGLLK